MKLSPDEKNTLSGDRGEMLAKIMKTLVMYGDAFGAEKMVRVTGEGGHLVTSFGLSVMKPVYALLDKLIASGSLSGQKFTVNPRPLNPVCRRILSRKYFSK